MTKTELLIAKIKSLPPERIEEVTDFVDFLAIRARERAVTAEWSNVSVPSFRAIWDNPEDDVYDAL